MKFLRRRDESFVLDFVESACTRGVIQPGRLEKQTGLPLQAALLPLLDSWSRWGLMSEKDGTYVYTAAGRYWYRTIMRILLRTAEYLLSGPPGRGEQIPMAAYGKGMKNMT
jgi:oxygen-independent coproporphyrinogen-3 oxidase